MHDGQMKTLKLFSLLAAVALLAGGCDFIRASLGKPTSADIQAIRDRIAMEEEAARKAEADSIANAQLMAQEQEKALLYSGNPAGRYNILSGAFKDSVNAVARMDEIRAKGYDARLLRMRSGYMAVIVFVSDDSAEAYSRYNELAADSNFGFDICIHDAKAELQAYQQSQNN